MDTNQIIGLVSGIAGALAAIITALIPLVQMKYRKPLQQANVAIGGINTVASAAIKHYQLHKAQYDAVKAAGNIPPEVMAKMAAEVAASLHELMGEIQTTVDELKAVK